MPATSSSFPAVPASSGPIFFGVFADSAKMGDVSMNFEISKSAEAPGQVEFRESPPVSIHAEASSNGLSESRHQSQSELRPHQISHPGVTPHSRLPGSDGYGWMNSAPPRQRFCTIHWYRMVQSLQASSKISRLWRRPSGQQSKHPESSQPCSWHLISNKRMIRTYRSPTNQEHAAHSGGRTAKRLRRPFSRGRNSCSIRRIPLRTRCAGGGTLSMCEVARKRCSNRSPAGIWRAPTPSLHLTEVAAPVLPEPQHKGRLGEAFVCDVHRMSLLGKSSKEANFLPGVDFMNYTFTGNTFPKKAEHDTVCRLCARVGVQDDGDSSATVCTQCRSTRPRCQTHVLAAFQPGTCSAPPQDASHISDMTLTNVAPCCTALAPNRLGHPKTRATTRLYRANCVRRRSARSAC